MNLQIVVYLLGWVITLESAFMTLPALVGLIYGEKQGIVYIATAALFAIIGVLAIIKKPKNMQFFAKEGFAIVGLSWIAMSIIGAVPFCLSGDIPNYVDALFEITSGFTTTGASILTDIESLSHATLFWRSFSHWIGGMGVFVFLLIIMPLVGGYNMHLLRAESPGPTVGKLVPKAKQSAKILYAIYFSMTFIQFLLLVIAKMPVFDAICTALGTAGTGGFGIKGDSMASYSLLIQWIVTVFMILFGVNFNLYFYILRREFKLAFKMEEVMWYFGIIAGSVLLIFIFIVKSYDSWFKALTDSAFQVGSIITTTGFATADFNLWPTLPKVILVGLMFMGACAGSTGGGLKVSRYLIFVKAVKQEINTFIHPRSVKSVEMDGKVLDKSTIKSVCVYLCLFAIVYTGSLFIISFDAPDVTTAFTSVVATINNIGPGLEVVGPAGNFAGFSVLSKFVFIFDMLAGRLELFPIILLLVPSLWKKH